MISLVAETAAVTKQEPLARYLPSLPLPPTVSWSRAENSLPTSNCQLVQGRKLPAYLQLSAGPGQKRRSPAPYPDVRKERFQSLSVLRVGF
jgi:hypothetical protein